MSATAALAEYDVLWRPHDGPQTRFLASPAYEVLYGGAAGGGKSDALLYGGLRQVDHPEYKALFIRESYPELATIMDRSQRTFRRLGATWNEQRKRWAFPSGAYFEFGYCASYKDVLRYQGQEFTYVAWDELGQVPEERMWTYLMSRNRTTAPDLSLSMRASANPGGVGHAWIKRRFVDPCKPDGTPIIDQSTGLTRAFFAAKLSDNPTLEENDPQYRQRLLMLPEVTRKQLLDGDWSAGEGMALSELNRDVHIVDPFDVPDRWFHWGAFDWGFNHPWWFGHLVADEDGNVILVDSVTGRRQLPHEIAERITSRVPVKLLRKIHAGHDIWQDHKARGENTPTVADQLRTHGLSMSQANISRKAGLNNMRRYLTHAEGRPPRFTMFRTPDNLRVFECLEGMVVDPDDREDALKVDADEYGQGGDDPYDMLRYGLAARPLVGKPVELPEISAFSPEILALDAERKRKLSYRLEKRRKLRRQANPDSLIG